VDLGVGAVDREVDRCDCVALSAVGEERRHDSRLESNTVRDDVPGHLAVDDRIEDRVEARMERRLSTGEPDVIASIDPAYVVEEVCDEIDGDVARALLWIAQAVFAVELTAIRDVKNDPG
jgi:hypothetical protein